MLHLGNLGQVYPPFRGSVSLFIKWRCESCLPGVIVKNKYRRCKSLWQSSYPSSWYHKDIGLLYWGQNEAPPPVVTEGSSTPLFLIWSKKARCSGLMGPAGARQERTQDRGKGERLQAAALQRTGFGPLSVPQFPPGSAPIIEWALARPQTGSSSLRGRWGIFLVFFSMCFLHTLLLQNVFLLLIYLAKKVCGDRHQTGNGCHSCCLQLCFFFFFLGFLLHSSPSLCCLVLI